jgi:hypothetical protein
MPLTSRTAAKPGGGPARVEVTRSRPAARQASRSRLAEALWERRLWKASLDRIGRDGTIDMCRTFVWNMEAVDRTAVGLDSSTRSA